MILLKWLVALGMGAVGALHFLQPQGFVAIVPTFLPRPLAIVYLSGVIEIVLGAALLFDRTRRWAAYGLIALFIAVFPANINMAINHIQLDPAAPIPVWAMWARLPLQFVFIFLAWLLARRAPHFR